MPAVPRVDEVSVRITFRQIYDSSIAAQKRNAKEFLQDLEQWRKWDFVQSEIEENVSHICSWCGRSWNDNLDEWGLPACCNPALNEVTVARLPQTCEPFPPEKLPLDAQIVRRASYGSPA